MSQALFEWLSTRSGISNVRLARITIGEQTWEGARYTRTMSYTAGMDAVTRGIRKAGDTYNEDCLYVLGDLPKPYVRHITRKGHVHTNNACFPFEGFDWYVSGYMIKRALKPEFEQWHPFGPNFILRPWDIDKEKIDQYCPKPYDRVELKVEYL